LDSEIIHIQPNPEAHADVVAVATQNNECRLIRFMTNEIMATISNVTTMSWSPKGKQIACGTRDGSIIPYDIEGTQKDEISPLPSQTGFYGESVVYL
jgi:WD40 repeat protein